jgi:thiamine kinase-like enzyme
MSTAPTTLKSPKVDVAIHRVGGAWRDLCDRSAYLRLAPPVTVTAIKPQRPDAKSGIYRLERAGPSGSNVIAKRCTRPTALIERQVYERVLPRLSVPAPDYYGSLDEPGQPFVWLFLEDAGNTKMAQADADLAAEWLAHLHADAAALATEVELPDRGPNHYLAELRTADAMFATFLREDRTPDDVRRALHILRRLIPGVTARWDAMRSVCACFPRTLVHGDFARQNIRLRLTTSRTQLLALDWETAGWGSPAADIPHWPTRFKRPRAAVPGGKPPSWNGAVPLGPYADRLGIPRGGTRGRDLERLARVGTIFRTIAAIRWAADEIQGGGMSKGGERLCWFAEFLPRALAEVDC